MKIVVVIVYWVIVALWVAIVSTVITFYFANRRTFGTTRLLLAVLALDGLRNVFENVYFGLYFGSGFGFFPPALSHFLGNPCLIILPKLANIAAGGIVMGLLLLRWLPQAIQERNESDCHSKKLHELATIDGMTGLRNRREFMLQGNVEWERATRYRQPLSLLLLDIDFFKAINDRYGHDTGDHVIIGVANICQTEKRASDIAGRLGGEEFAILLPQTFLADAVTFAERLRYLIAGHTIMDLKTTVSIGVSDAYGAGSITGLLKQADAALYEAKRGGRDRVCQFAALIPYAHEN